MSKRRSDEEESKGAAAAGSSSSSSSVKTQYVPSAQRTVLYNRQLLTALTGRGYLAQADLGRAAQVGRLWHDARRVNTAAAVRKGLAWVDAFERDFARLKRDFQRFEANGFRGQPPFPLFGEPPPPPGRGPPDVVSPPERLTKEEVELFLRAPQAPLLCHPDLYDEGGFQTPPRYTTTWARVLFTIGNLTEVDSMADVCQAFGPWAAFAHLVNTRPGRFVSDFMQMVLLYSALENGTPALARCVLLESVACPVSLPGGPAQVSNYVLSHATTCALLDLDSRRVFDPLLVEGCRVLHDTLVLSRMPGVRLPRNDPKRHLMVAGDDTSRNAHRFAPGLLPPASGPVAGGADAGPAAPVSTPPRAAWPPTEATQVDFAAAVSPLRARLGPAPPRPSVL